ncbi:MAG: 2-phospho-L-lactate transferase [Pseudomonadales bacterium]|nr:2-phospho-L-lactate transferase [Pseudomonadales bacterium]
MSLKPEQTVLALSGGVGGAKLALGLTRLLPPEQLSIVINSGDDFDHLGLHISPDIDTHLYALSGRDNPQTGWGQRDETWSFMESIRELKGEDWFQLGDRDLALHVLRTQHLKQGRSLTEITQSFAEAFGIEHTLIPMSDDPVRTIVKTKVKTPVTNTKTGMAEVEDLPFQRYFVEQRCQPEVAGFCFEGIESAAASPDFVKRLNDSNLAAVVICPSNPYVSIDPILLLPAVRQALINSPAKVIAVSPIVGGVAVKGPAAKMMAELEIPASPLSIAAHYHDLLDGLVIDQLDRSQGQAIRATGLPVLVTDTMMVNLDIKQSLAEAALEFALNLNSDD